MSAEVDKVWTRNGKERQQKGATKLEDGWASGSGGQSRLSSPSKKTLGSWGVGGGERGGNKQGKTTHHHLLEGEVYSQGLEGHVRRSNVWRCQLSLILAATPDASRDQ